MAYRVNWDRLYAAFFPQHRIASSDRSWKAAHIEFQMRLFFGSVSIACAFCNGTQMPPPPAHLVGFVLEKTDIVRNSRGHIDEALIQEEVPEKSGRRFQEGMNRAGHC